MAVGGGNQGRQAIHDATTEQLRSLIPDIERSIKDTLGEQEGQEIRARIQEIWPDI